MKSLKERIQFSDNGGRVVRFHQHVGHRLNTDAQHSHGVAMLCYFLTPELPSVNLLMAALTHDLAEQCWGDVPYPTKRNIAGLKATLDQAEIDALRLYDLSFPLTEAERATLNLADALDGILYCASEAALGNRTLSAVCAVWTEVVLRLSDEGAHNREVVNAVLQIWKESNDAQGPQYIVGTR